VRVPPIDSWSVEHGDRKKRTHEDIYRWSSPITFVAYEAIVGINRHDDEYQVLRSKFPGVDGFVYIGPGGRPFDDREHESLRGMRAEVIAFDRKVAAGDGAARWLASEIETSSVMRRMRVSKKIKVHTWRRRAEMRRDLQSTPRRRIRLIHPRGRSVVESRAKLRFDR
jgi:hypothetical protein